MKTITTANLKQNTVILQDAIKDDLLITKEDKPFVVVMDFKKYKLIEKYINKIANDETYQAISNLENDENISTYNTKKDLFDDLGI